MQETTQQNVNNAILTGIVCSSAVYSHEIFGEKFYEVMLEVKRLSDMTDMLPISISDRLIDNNILKLGNIVTVTGQFRSYNKIVDNKSKLMLTLFAKDIVLEDNVSNVNQIELIGYICKPPIYRTTPFNREITDILVAVNRQYNKSDYIPCIAWGRNARYSNTLPVGQLVRIVGRIQSRQYQKKITDSQLLVKTAYEVSVNSIECYTMGQASIDAMQ